MSLISWNGRQRTSQWVSIGPNSRPTDLSNELCFYLVNIHELTKSTYKAEGLWL